jgi:hypothetical protein
MSSRTPSRPPDRPICVAVASAPLPLPSGGCHGGTIDQRGVCQLHAHLGRHRRDAGQDASRHRRGGRAGGRSRRVPRGCARGLRFVRGVPGRGRALRLPPVAGAGDPRPRHRRRGGTGGQVRMRRRLRHERTRSRPAHSALQRGGGRGSRRTARQLPKGAPGVAPLGHRGHCVRPRRRTAGVRDA